MKVKTINYRTSGTCSREIIVQTEDNKIVSVEFVGGCSGNTQGIAALVRGMDVNEAIGRLKGIRCGLCSDPLSAELTRKHNNANMLAMGAGIIGPNMAERIVDVFLSTEFEGGRHARRVGLMMDIEKE